jgi:20S proteasome subunit alpha 2
VVQEATQSGGVRPYGVSLLIAGWDEGVEPEGEAQKDDSEEKTTTKTGGIHKGGPSLYQVDPSGSYYPWKATAIGKHATSAKTFLEKRYTEGLELEDAIHIALLTLKETIEGEMNGDTIEIGEFGSHSPPLSTSANPFQVLLAHQQTTCWALKEWRVPRDRGSAS